MDAVDYSDYSVERWVTDVANLNSALEPAARLNERSNDEFVALTAATAASSSSGAVSSADARSSGAVATILNAFLGRCVDESPGSPYQSSGSSRTTGSSSAAAEGVAYAFRASTTEAAGDGDGGDLKWACARCTFLNHPALPDCELCSSSRSVTPLQLPVCMTRLPNQTHSASTDSIVPNSTVSWQ